MPDKISKTDLEFLANHVFFPPKLPQKDDYSIGHVHALCDSILQSAEKYRDCVPSAERERWDTISRMLKHLRATQEYEALSKEGVKDSIMKMQVGDVIAVYIRAQNAGLIIRKLADESIFESFEVSLPNAEVMKAEGKILRSFPGPAIAVPCDTVNEPAFVEELSSFITQMNVDVHDDAVPKTTKAGSTVTEIRDTTHPCYITQLLTGILRGMGHAGEVTRIAKRISDDVLWNDTFAPWRRSPLWLVIRVAIQTSLCQGDGHADYKSFMVFAMARMMREILDADFSSDLLFCMRSKICRRLYKLGPAAPEFVEMNVQEVAAATEEKLKERWSSAQRFQAASASWAPETLDIAKDTHLSLPHSGKYLQQVMKEEVSRSPSALFEPHCTPRFRLPLDFCDYEENSLADAAKSDPFVALADFELAVQEGLDHWVDRNLHVDTSCETIASCFTQYYDAAKTAYATNPESQSIMLLTLVELWVAVDQLAIAQCPLLRDYSPEFPLNLMEPLLLRKSKALERIKCIETYIQARHDRAKAGPVFIDNLHENTFAIRYFNSSPKHQALLSKIEDLATSAQMEKLEELKRMNAEHRDLQREYSSMEHHWSTDCWGDYAHLSYQCPRCDLEQRANNMRIAVHEWPLSRQPLQAKAAVFELQCPSFFDTWRSITYQFLSDICTVDDTPSCDPPVRLHTYRGLEGLGIRNPSHRITYASPTKSFMNSHYSETAIPADESSVCVNNGLKFRLFDAGKSKWAASRFLGCGITQYCTLQLPPGPYAILQYAVEKTSHTSNQMLANQEDCPKDISLLEYAAFVGLRSGPRLQWLNIAREIRARALTFRRQEVHILLTQAAWEIGPLRDESREWHAELRIAEFASVLLRELSNLLTSVEANWAEVISVRTIIALITRILVSAGDHPRITHEAYTLLRKSRRVTFIWMHQLAEKLRKTEDEEKVREFQYRVCEVAATCRGTYDVDPQHLHAVLHSLDDYAVLVECTIVVHDNTPSSLTGLPSDFTNLLDRDRRLSHTIEPLFLQRGPECLRGVDRALTAVWSGYPKGSSWLPLASPNDRWLVATTATAGQESQCIHFGFLEGQLLIDGKPLSRLPETFLRHPTYTRIFGRMIIDVIPANMPGMDFAARSPIFKHQVFFAMRDNDTRLVVRTTRKSQTLELVPHGTFVGDLPSPLVHNYVHWMNPSDGKVELRPLSSIWESSSKNWELQLSNYGLSTMRKDSVLLVDIHSLTFDMIHSSLKLLEYPEFLVVTRCRENQSLLAELPRFRLSFFLNESNSLQSQNLPGMVVDSDQCTGTMIGLSNQLVMRMGDSIAGNLPRSRRVIIPSGKVTYNAHNNHVAVSVDTRSEVSVKYYEYKIDTDLGCLIGDGSLASKLYKAYLHATSSHCLPDPLTGCTGTQEALRELHHAGCFSFQALSTVERQILRSISTLAPIHKYYPPHLEVMQSVTWSGLPALAQHQGFYWATQSITAYAERMQVFEVTARNDNARSAEDVPDEHLQIRAARRMELFDPDETIELLSPHKPDMTYTSRDSVMTTHDGMKDETVAFRVASTVHRWPPRLNTDPELLKTLIDWKSIGQRRVTPSYSREWLQRNPSDTWISMYNLFRGSERNKNRFQLAFCLSAMAYGSVESRDLVPTLLAFATNPQFSALSPPPCLTYNLALGFSPQRSKLLQLINSHGSFTSSNEAQLSARYKETAHALAQRRQSAYRKRLETQAATVADYCISQWPCQEANLPPTPSDDWVFDFWSVSTQITAHFVRWFHNLQLKHHIEEVQCVLDGMRSPSPTATPSYYPSPSSQPLGSSRGTLVTFDQLFQREPPGIVGCAPKPLPIGDPEIQSPSDSSDLRDLLSELQESKNVFRRLYGHNLDESRKKFMDDQIRVFPTLIPHSLEVLIGYGNQCRTHLEECLTSIRGSLSPLDLHEHMIHLGGQWPQITFGSLLRKLATTHRKKPGSQWEEVLALLARRMLLYQRSQRLIHLALLKNRDEFFRELENTTYDNQNAMKSVDWLLIQIDSNFLARPIQLDVADQMISPKLSRQNTVLQLNMGEGKSSVIVPMVAATLANFQTLTRVVVLKSLSNQMFQLLVERLSGLANRRIFYMPFSRSVKLGSSQAMIIGDLYKECMEAGGILVVQPEHILSFKLMV